MEPRKRENSSKNFCTSLFLKETIALQNASATALRLRHVLQCAEYLDGMDLRCFVFDRETGQFCRKDREESPAARPMRVQSSRSDDTFTGFEDEVGFL